jgi:hypothetical protein
MLVGTFEIHHAVGPAVHAAADLEVVANSKV